MKAATRIVGSTPPKRKATALAFGRPGGAILPMIGLKSDACVKRCLPRSQTVLSMNTVGVFLAQFNGHCARVPISPDGRLYGGCLPPAVMADPKVGCTHPTTRPSQSNSIEECYARLNRPVFARTTRTE
jgi:hypothetical protein